MIWKTKISKATKQKTILHGDDLDELTKKINFTQAIFLTLKGEMPTKKEEKMLNAILVSSVDHGVGVSSIITARCTAAAGNQFNSSVAAGIGTLGKYHGGAIEDCAKILKQQKNAKEIVSNALSGKKRLLGFGHKIYTKDPRTQTLLSIAKENKIFGKHCKLALEIEKELEKQKKRKLCLNIDGCIAAIILDMGFPCSIGNAFFIISRSIGICAHVHEELTEEKPVRRIEDEKYIGKKSRKL